MERMPGIGSRCAAALVALLGATGAAPGRDAHDTHPPFALDRLSIAATGGDERRP